MLLLDLPPGTLYLNISAILDFNSQFYASVKNTVLKTTPYRTTLYKLLCLCAL